MQRVLSYVCTAGGEEVEARVPAFHPIFIRRECVIREFPQVAGNCWRIGRDNDLEYGRKMALLRPHPARILVALAGVAAVTFFGYRLMPVNATTVGFAYLLLILVIASPWGFFEAALSSILATLLFNFFF